MDPETREEIKRLEGYISGLSLTVAGIRHDLNACPCSETSGPRPLSRKEYMQTEPVVLTTAIAVVLYNLATLFGVGIDQDTVTQIVVSVGALVAAVIARQKVTPV